MEGIYGNFWSTNVQGVKTLFLSRSLRFKDGFFKDFENIFNIDKDKKVKILELGCGPGALIHRLSEVYPNASLYGLDRDRNFIDFANEFVVSGKFFLDDLEDLYFKENDFDIVISYTLAEHIDPDCLLSIQEKLLKKGGKMIIMSVLHSSNDILNYVKLDKNLEDEEEKVWERLRDVHFPDLKEEGVRKFNLSEAELFKKIREFSFKDISINNVFTRICPDDDEVSEELANLIFDTKKISQEEILERLYRDDYITDDEAELLLIIWIRGLKLEKKNMKIKRRFLIGR